MFTGQLDVRDAESLHSPAPDSGHDAVCRPPGNWQTHFTALMLPFRFFRRPVVDVEQAMRKAHAFQESGNSVDAEPLCHAVLKTQPDHFDALQLLGAIRLQQRKCDEADQFFTAALQIDPNALNALSSRGDALMGLDRPAEALANHDRALAIRADFIPSLCGRADALRSLQRNQEAAADYSRALEIAPDNPRALSGLGHALEAQGCFVEALAAYEKALAVVPDDAASLNDRAGALFNLGRHAEAMIDLDKALAIDSALVAALICRGNVLHMTGQSELALVEYDKAIAADPDFAGGPYNRAIVLRSLDRYAEAIAAYQWATAIKPDFTQALFNCGALQSERYLHVDALASFEQILAVDPDYPHAAGNAWFQHAQMCSWDGWDDSVQHLEEDVRLGKPVIVPLAFLALSQDAQVQRTCAESLIAKHHPASSQPCWKGEVYRHDRIRVGYLSADFQEHAVAFLVADLLEQHDHARFEVIGIAFGPDIKCPMRTRIEATFDRFVEVRTRSDADVAMMMREMEIDIAVDLMGFTNHSRTGIFARRPAPVQVNYLGYPGTMGGAYMDYIIADRFIIPDAQRIHYAENVVYLPDTFQANDSKRRSTEVTLSRAAFGLPPEGMVFCAFNNSYKISPAMFSIWMRLLERVPGSVLWLVAGTPFVEINLRREAQQRGVAPDRLVFAQRVSYADYLAQYRLADLFLDTFPFNGGTTASDALWMGVPVLTCAGEAFAARMAGSLLHAIGLPELITHSLVEYESLALDLATDVPRLATIKQKLAINRDSYPLFGTNRFRRNIEAAYVTMWERTLRSEPPSSFAVEQ